MHDRVRISDNFTQDFANFLASKIQGKIRKKVLFVTDEKIWKNCSRFFAQDFLPQNYRTLILKNPHPDEKNLQKIAKNLHDVDLIIALGSGTINDLCKYTSAQRNIPYAIIASALSMNGYLSRNASITISRHKKTLPATLPEAVFCDVRILKSAPTRLTKAGIGDSLCFYSCWFDWYLSHKIYNTYFSDQPFQMLSAKMELLLKNYHKFSLRDDKFIQLLTEILLLSGQGMTIANGSYPASQSEHMIAHTIEMKYPKVALNKLHGEMIAVTTFTSSELQKKLLSCKEIEIIKSDKMSNFFSAKVNAQCRAEYEQKLKLVSQKFNWESLKKELRLIHLDQEKLRKVFKHFAIKFTAKSLHLSNQQYQSCVLHAKFTRNRFTVLDL